MTWEAIAVGAMCSVSYWIGHVRGKAMSNAKEWEDGRMSGLGTAYHAAKAALDAPSKGKPGRSIVGRAIVRKLRALAEGTGE